MELRNNKIPVFVDVTAAWCITCQYNKKVAISTEVVRRHFEDKGIVTLVADWTQKDPKITQYLSSFNRIGVPLYVYYPVDKEPVILPQILTSKGIISSCQ